MPPRIERTSFRGSISNSSQVTDQSAARADSLRARSDSAPLQSLSEKRAGVTSSAKQPRVDLLKLSGAAAPEQLGDGEHVRGAGDETMAQVHETATKMAIGMMHSTMQRMQETMKQMTRGIEDDESDED